MMMQGCHFKNSPAAAELEITDLDNHRQRLDYKDTAHYHQKDFLLGNYGNDAPSTAPRGRDPTSPMKIWAG
jgi:hypothetical protein